MEVVLPPGIVKTKSGAAAQGRYIDAQWVRFSGGLPEKIRGYSKIYDTAISGVPRGVHSWLGPDGFELRGMGTEQKLGVADLNDTAFTNITPLRTDGASLGNDPFAVVDGSTTVTVTHSSHGAVQGDTVVFDGASAGGGITVDGEYVITSITSDNVYTVEHSSAATSTDATTGGGSVTADYEINVGYQSPALGVGYGVGPYGEETYGDPRTTSAVTLEYRRWSLDNYGDWLIGAYTDGGTIYTYDHGTDTRAQAVSNAPSDVRYVFVTEEHFVVALRAALEVSWPDQDDITDWTPSATNTSETRTLGTGTKLVAGAPFGGGTSLIWTDTALYQMQYVGGTAVVYETRMIGDRCGLIGPGAFCSTEGQVFWMCGNAFHLYNGSILAIPNADDVHDWVYNNISASQKSKTVAFYNAREREVWFVWPLEGSLEPGYYAMVNIDTWVWSTGTLSRVGGSLAPSPASGLLLSDPDGYLYKHETGLDADGSALDWYLESGLWRIPGAERSVDLWGFSPDNERQVGDITLTITSKDRPMSSSSETSTSTISTTTEMTDIRQSGRYFKYKLSQSSVVGGDFRQGVPVLETGVAGARR